MKFVNLTSRSQKPYSGYGDKIMEGKPDMPPSSQPTNPEGSEAKPISAKNKRAADMMALGKDQKLPVGVRRALEDIKRQEVIKNALLGDSERVDVAAKLLKRDLTEKEKNAVLKAHNQGKGEAGKYNGPAGVYNYTDIQLLKKTRILNEAGFSKEDRRILMEAGLVGAEGKENESVIKDKKAAELIEQFKRTTSGFKSEGEERGEYGRHQDQLRLDLARRIKELATQQEELGDTDGAYTSDGKLTPETAAKIDELNEKIRQIHNFFGTQERGRRGDPAVNDLIDESSNFVNGLISRGLKKDDVNNLSESTKLTPGEKAIRINLVRRIQEAIHRTGPIDTSEFNSDILFAARHFTELREQLISNILFKSFGDKSETNNYEISLYAGSNLDMLLGFLSVDDSVRYGELFSLRTAASFFQTMNKTVIVGTFDEFGRAAENINYQHFENMRDVGGSGLVMRLFEQAYKDTLANDKRVMQDKVAIIKDFVETTFREMNEAGLIKSQYSQYRGNSKMEEWEIQRALAAGRTFLNITLRAAESIATGRVPDGRRRYSSPPQEDMVRILNWNEQLLRKFTVGGGKEGRHGEEFLQMSIDEFQKFLRFKGAKLDINRITEFGGVNVRTLEEAGQYKTSGIYSGWRLENMAFDQVYLRDENGNLIRDEKRVLKPEDTVLIDEDGKAFMTVQGFRDQQEIKDKIKTIKDRIEARTKANPNRDPKDQITEEDQKEYRDILMPAINKLDIGLSMLLKNGDFGAQDNKLGYLLRQEIWKKIARTNTPLMIDYLTDIKYSDGTPDAEKARTIETIRKTEVPEWNEDRWRNFKKKEMFKFERTVREGQNEELPDVVELDADERRLEEAIKLEGEKLAPHLADIVFAYTPFMNDVPFEKFKYNIPGQTFYKRRTVSDLGGYNKGQQSYNKIVDNPGGLTAKEVVEAMHEIVAGITGPEGPRSAMEANFPTFSALLDVVATDPGKRQAILKMLLEVARKETSIAQRWAGIKADSFIEGEEANLIDDATRAGILNPELARYLKKDKRLTFSAILWMLFRDVFLMVPVFAAGEFYGAVKGK